MPPATLLNGLFFGLLAFLGVYGLHRLQLVRRFRDWGPAPEPLAPEAEHPRVCVQLPLYNERTVAARLIRRVGALEWPADRLEIQVLDDSTDETRALVDQEVELLRSRGLNARVLRREGREGFKAGALAHGMAHSDAPYIAVFDADFLPQADFLQRTLPAFDSSEVGLVQARWGHLDRDRSGFARAQSTLLDGHFVIEHHVRCLSGLFFNFNGTAGVWRREAIEDAGGWEHDTLTEDLDLSYRSQMAGWRFVYLPSVVADAELPPDVAAFKSQQARWARGSAQVLRKLGGRIARADLPWRVKLEAFLHLTHNIGYPLVPALAFLLPLVMLQPMEVSPWAHLALFCLCSVSIVVFYDKSQRATGRPLLRRLFDVPAAMALGIGLSLRLSRAVLLGLFAGPGEFVRTPKRGDGAGQRYRSLLNGVPGLELLPAAWLGWACWMAIADGAWSALPLMLLFAWGYAWIGWLSLRVWWRERGTQPSPAEGRAATV